MKKNKTNITKALRTLEMKDTEYETMSKFIVTMKGRKFAQRINKEPIEHLIARFGAPKIKSTKKTQWWKNMWKYIIKKNDITTEIYPGVKDYTNLRQEKAKAGEFKLPKRLTKCQLMRINSGRDNYVIKTDFAGKPIKRSEDGKILYDIRANEPLYKYIPKPKNRGMDLKCHLYEIHKMAKWDKEHPKPTLVELKQDLFPDELLAAYRTRRYIYNEYVRQLVTEMFYKTKPYHNPFSAERQLKLFKVRNIKGVISEVECYGVDYGYPFSLLPQYPTTDQILKAIIPASKRVESDVTKLKVYNKYGNCIVEYDMPKELRISMAA